MTRRDFTYADLKRYQHELSRPWGPTLADLARQEGRNPGSISKALVSHLGWHYRRDGQMPRMAARDARIRANPRSAPVVARLEGLTASRVCAIRRGEG